MQTNRLMMDGISFHGDLLQHFSQQHTTTGAITEEEETRRAIMLSSNVVPALSVPQYLDRLVLARVQAWQDIQNCIEDGKFRQLSDSLVLSPFDDVRQCAFYLPWCVHTVVLCRQLYVYPCTSHSLSSGLS